MREITLTAAIENLQAATDFVNEVLEEWDAPPKVIAQFSIAIDEIFSNIAYYAYSDAPGPVTVGVEVDKGVAVVLFKDRGIPYNPLMKDDPDTSLSAEEREIGGLGIYMVKKSMDALSYEYRDGQNILKLTKKI